MFIIINALSGQYNSFPGWSSLISSILFFGGLISFSIGIMLEYMGVVMGQVQGKPTYFVIDRSNKLCKNNVKTVDVIKDAIKKYEKFEFENICCIYPCNPLLKVDDIKKCLKLSEKNKKKFIFPVREYSHPTERAFYLKGRNKKIK